MEELKFRAWSELQNDHFVFPTGGPKELLPFLRWCGGVSIEMLTPYLDKNGKDIYEGDILRAWLDDKVEPDGGLWCYMEVRNTEYFGFILWGERSDVSDACPLPTMLAWVPWEVVGNIHENADLLTSQQLKL